jgi:glucose-6-phosphate isomerase
MQGKSLAQATTELLKNGVSESEAAVLAPHKVMKGNTPSNTILLETLTPNALGALLALYEHKIFVQGVIWQVNSYDQWGVELGKQLGNEVLAAMSSEKFSHSDVLSTSSLTLIARYKNTLSR